MSAWALLMARLDAPGFRRRAVAALSEQSTYSGLQGAALFIGLSESRFAAIAGVLVFVFAMVKIAMPDAADAR